MAFISVCLFQYLVFGEPAQKLGGTSRQGSGRGNGPVRAHLTRLEEEAAEGAQHKELCDAELSDSSFPAQQQYSTHKITQKLYIYAYIYISINIYIYI